MGSKKSVKKLSVMAEQAYSMTSRIPKGRVSTYGAIARAIGREGASRAVGGVLRSNPHPIVVPCHRVVHSDGRIGGYGGSSGSGRKIRLLASEGVKVRDGVVQDFQRVLFDDFSLAEK